MSIPNFQRPSTIDKSQIIQKYFGRMTYTHMRSSKSIADIGTKALAIACAS